MRQSFGRYDTLDEDCERVMRLLKKHPALVSNFAVDEKFLKCGEYFQGTVEKFGETFYQSTHAMVLIGGLKRESV